MTRADLIARSARGAGLDALEQRVLFALDHPDVLSAAPSLADLDAGRRQTAEDFAAELARLRETLGVARGGRAAAEAVDLRLPGDELTARQLIDALGGVDLSRLVDAGIQPSAIWDLDHTIFTGMSPQLIAPALVRLNPFRHSANTGLVDGMLRTGAEWGVDADGLRRRSVAENLALVLEREEAAAIGYLQRNELVARSLAGMTPSDVAAIADSFYTAGVAGVASPHVANLLGDRDATAADVIAALDAHGIRCVIVSAGFDFLAQAGARAIGFPPGRVFGSVLEVSDGGELTGRIAVDLHRRSKTDWIQTRLRPPLLAFGDSPDADGPVMDLAVTGFMVDPGVAFYERNRSRNAEYRTLHFADPVRPLDTSAGPIATKYRTVIGRHRGSYSGTTVHGTVTIPRCFDPDADLERVVRDADRSFRIDGLHAGQVAVSTFVALIHASLPDGIDRRIDNILDAARDLAVRDLAAPFPESVAEMEWLRWIMRFTWAHSRDNERLLHALGYHTDTIGRHDFDENTTVRALLDMLDGRRQSDERVPWVENLRVQVLERLSPSDEFGIGIANPHLTVSFANWRPEAPTPAGWFHLTSGHHNGSPVAPVDPIEAGVNDFLHYLREHHFGVVKCTMKSFLDLGWLLDRGNVAHIAALMKSELMARAAADLAPLVRRFEQEGIITPWHLMDTRLEDKVLYEPTPSASTEAILPTIQRLFAASFNPAYGTRRVRPGELEASLSNGREVTFQLYADERLRDPLSGARRVREGAHYLGKYDAISGAFFAFEVGGPRPVLAPGLHLAGDTV